MYVCREREVCGSDAHPPSYPGRVVVAFTTEYDANPYASWVDTNVKMRMFGSGMCICFVTPDPIDIKITIPCTII